ncbi:Kinesin protein [Fasciola gigantica]|uniref:Kinesin protein n=1 Tax=Fasciola gigantica TaxID=46835 RepID=A0A504Y360_FASGI|nr:Kinesin protein [Fasciola gigantica]
MEEQDPNMEVKIDKVEGEPSVPPTKRLSENVPNIQVTAPIDDSTMEPVKNVHQGELKIEEVGSDPLVSSTERPSENVPNIQLASPGENSTLGPTTHPSIASDKTKNQTSEERSSLNKNSRSHSANLRENKRTSGNSVKINTANSHENVPRVSGGTVDSTSDHRTHAGSVRSSAASKNRIEGKLNQPKLSPTRANGSIRNSASMNKTDKKPSVGHLEPEFRKSGGLSTPPSRGGSMKQNLMRGIHEDPMLHPMDELSKRTSNVTAPSQSLRSASTRRSPKVLEESSQQKIPVSSASGIPPVVENENKSVKSRDLDAGQKLAAANSSIHSASQNRPSKASQDYDPNEKLRCCADLLPSDASPYPVMTAVKDTTASVHSAKGEPLKIASQSSPEGLGSTTEDKKQNSSDADNEIPILPQSCGSQGLEVPVSQKLSASSQGAAPSSGSNLDRLSNRTTESIKRSPAPSIGSSRERLHTGSTGSIKMDPALSVGRAASIRREPVSSLGSNRDINPVRSSGSIKQKISPLRSSLLSERKFPERVSFESVKSIPKKSPTGSAEALQNEPMRAETGKMSEELFYYAPVTPPPEVEQLQEKQPFSIDATEDAPDGADLAGLEPMVTSEQPKFDSEGSPTGSSNLPIIEPTTRRTPEWNPDIMEQLEEANDEARPSGRIASEQDRYSKREISFVTLSTAGFCDANETAYFPLQVKIAALEAKLSEYALNYAELQDKYETLQNNYVVLEKNLKNANIIARDQVVFENLKMNYQLVSSELEEYRMLLREIRKIGWENLPQRMMQDCKDMQEKLAAAKKDRDRALHEESAARGIANEALKQVKLMRNSIETHSTIIEELEAQREFSRQAYTKALQRVQEDYEHRALIQQSRDQRRQAHLEFLVQELKTQLEQSFDGDMKDTVFHSNLSYYYPSLEECRVGLMQIDGNPVELTTDEQKQFFIKSKLPKEIADALMDPRRSLPESKKGRKSTARTAEAAKQQTTDDAAVETSPAESNVIASTELSKPAVMRSEDGDAKDPANAIQDERTAWEQLRVQWEMKVREKEKEITQLKEKINRLERDVEDLRNKRMMEMEADVRIKSLRDENAMLYEHYHTELVLRRKFHSQVEDLKGKIRVFCRIRAAQPSELSKKIPLVVQNSDAYTVMVRTEDESKYFPFDRVFAGNCTHEEMMEELGGLIQAAIYGFNVCILAYGQSDSGKSHTMQGDQRDPGIIPRSCTDVFVRLEQPNHQISFNTDVSISMFELHNDTITDLLKPTPQVLDDTSMTKDSNGVMQIQGLCRLSGLCAEEILEHFQRGQSHRAGHHPRTPNATADHCVTCITIVSTNKLTQITYTGKLTFVELAGSEKMHKPTNASDQNKDVRKFDQTLSALADVLFALHISQVSVPYRKSKLTTLLQDSIGGNAKTLMIVHINPTETSLMETLATLNYGSRVRFVKNDARQISNEEQVVKLQNTLGRLRRQE